MITWIKDTVKRYKFNTIDMFMQKIKDIEDINKIDEKYYNQMIEHKARRLQNRSLYVQDVSTLKQKVEQSSINNN